MPFSFKPAPSIRATETMYCRFLAELLNEVPIIDFRDVNQKRQFAPEYAQNVYATLRANEYAIGDYYNPCTAMYLKVSVEQRKAMVFLMSEIKEALAWKFETLQLAVNIADRYLIHLSCLCQQAPCLILLSTTCLILAAKLEQPLFPSFNKINKFFMRKYCMQVQKQKFVDLESKILIKLGFSLHYTYPTLFLERFQRLFDLDKEDVNK